ncbi:hypothetical protein [Providencia huaxiensis]
MESGLATQLVAERSPTLRATFARKWKYYWRDERLVPYQD